MSLTETLMLVALGFALALIIVLLVGRGLWSMAMRLGARRQSKQVPTAMLELQADRDRLRAEHAMMSRKLELRLEDIKTRMTEQMAEVSRHRNRIQSITAELERRDDIISTRDREVAALSAQLEVHRADLASSSDVIDKLSLQLREKETLVSQYAARVEQLSADIGQKDTLVANSGTGFQTAFSVFDNKPKTAVRAEPGENRLMQRVAELTNISSQMMHQRDGNPMLALPSANLNEVSIIDAAADQKPEAFETETAVMAAQLKELDSKMNSETATIDSQKKSGAMANVITLAQKIRALQKSVD